MSSLDDYNAKLPLITAMTTVVSPTMPVTDFLQDAEFLNQWCQPDREQLTNAGLDWTLVEDLPARIGALRQAETNWGNTRFLRDQAQEEWSKLSPEAFDKRDVLLHHLRFALRNMPDAKKTVDDIAEGNDNADMIQDLHRLGELGKQHPEALNAVNVDLALLDEAIQLADHLSELWAEAKTDSKTMDEALQIRNQAFTHLKEAVETIYEYGQYVFWRNEKRREGYASQYWRKRRRESQKKAQEKASE